MPLKKKTKILFTIFILVCMTATFATILKTPRASPMLGPDGEWTIMNSANMINLIPIQNYPFDVKISPITINETTYMFIYGAGQSSMQEIHRFNLSSGNWEVLSDGGWTNNAALPKPMTFVENIVFLKPLKFAASKNIMGIYSGITKTLSITLDTHDALRPFMFNGENFTRKNGTSTYGEYSSAPLISAYAQHGGDIATNGNDTLIAVAAFDTDGINGVSRIAAAKYVYSENDLTWKVWNGAEGNIWSSDLSARSSIVFNETPYNETFSVYQPRIIYLPDDRSYIVLFDVNIQLYPNKKIVCAARYSLDFPDQWQLWNGSWVPSDFGECTDVSGGSFNIPFISTNVNHFPEDFFGLTNEGISYITNWNSAIYETSYNLVSSSWSNQELLHSEITSFSAEVNSSGSIWLVYKKSNDSNIYLIKKDNDVWSSSEVLFSRESAEYKVAEMTFLENGNAIIFIETPGKIYAYTNGNFDENPAQRINVSLSYPAINSDVFSMRPLNNSWTLSVTYSSPYGRHFGGQMALDKDNYLYQPATVLEKVLIRNETDFYNVQDVWGNYWDYLLLPSAVAVDNIRGKVYVADYIAGYGAAFATYSGRVQVFNQSMRNQTIHYKPTITKNGITVPTLTITLPQKGGFLFPMGLAIDETNALLYVSDSMNHRIRVYDATSFDANGFPILLRAIGSRGKANGKFEFHQTLAVDKNSELYVADAGNHRIQVFDKNGNFLRSWGEKGYGQGQFIYPYSIAVDSELNLTFVSDPYSRRAQIYTKSGEWLYEQVMPVDSGASYSYYNFYGEVGGVVAFGNGSFGISVGGNIYKFNISSLDDFNANKIPDVLEQCHSDGCNGFCSPRCSHEQDPDCETSACDDKCRNGDETGVDCGNSCGNVCETQCESIVPPAGVSKCAYKNCDGKIIGNQIAAPPGYFLYKVSPVLCEYEKEKYCGDSVDNDGDELVDCDDFDCADYCSSICKDDDKDGIDEPSSTCLLGKDDYFNLGSKEGSWDDYYVNWSNVTLFDTIRPLTENFDVPALDNFVDLRSVDFNLSLNQKTRVKYLNNISLVKIYERYSGNSYSECCYFNIEEPLNLSKVFEINDTSISVNTSAYAYSQFNKSAEIYFYGTYYSPKILKDNGDECFPPVCVVEERTSEYVKVFVSHFSSYTIIETGSPPLTAPLAPSDLNVFNETNQSLTLNWTDNSDNEDGFKIERKNETEIYSEITVTNQNIEVLVDENLKSNTTYFYRIKAYNAIGDSSYTNEANATTNVTRIEFCGDGSCNNGESCSSCSADCGSCPSDGGDDGDDNDSPGGTSACISNWTCTEWTECSSFNQKTRTCADSKNCTIKTNKPLTTLECISGEQPSNTSELLNDTEQITEKQSTSLDRIFLISAVTLATILGFTIIILLWKTELANLIQKHGASVSKLQPTTRQ